MSRVGLAPITIPSGVDVTIAGRGVTVKGPKGQLERALPDDITVVREDGEIRVSRSKETREVKALHGLVRSLLANMIQGVTEGYEKRLEIQGVGYRVAKQGSDLELQVGYSHTVKY